MNLNIDENLYSNILISLTEAVNNAMIHGNRLDNQKTIVISFRRQGHRIHLFISDEGCGFDPIKVPIQPVWNGWKRKGGVVYSS
jgi:serine/threonine-protein kinase RsbW